MSTKKKSSKRKVARSDIEEVANIFADTGRKDDSAKPPMYLIPPGLPAGDDDEYSDEVSEVTFAHHTLRRWFYHDHTLSHWQKPLDTVAAALRRAYGKGAMFAVARVMAHGAEKYDAFNWTKGIAFSRLTSAALRHMTAHIEGDEIDPEFGEKHLAHALCCIGMLMSFDEDGEWDDRCTTWKESF